MILSVTARSKLADLESTGTALRQIISDVCIMDKLQQCALSHLKRDRIDWVQCMTCGAWYHCVCIGIAQEFFQEHGHDFLCCKTSESVDSST